MKSMPSEMGFRLNSMQSKLICFIVHSNDIYTIVANNFDARADLKGGVEKFLVG
jgi:hypothetical protein